MKTYYVYIISNKSRRLYVGITSDLARRVFQHKHKTFENSFTARYNFDMLVHFECHSRPTLAIMREKEIKGWRREKKLRLILASNPHWADLSAEWQGDESWQSMPGVMPPQVYRRRLREP
jgi:putative endonuclease